jgi:hypothetical protein
MAWCSVKAQGQLYLYLLPSSVPFCCQEVFLAPFNNVSYSLVLQLLPMVQIRVIYTLSHYKHKSEQIPSFGMRYMSITPDSSTFGNYLL